LPGSPAVTRRELEIEEDLAFQRRQWRFERMGALALLLFLVAAALGLFGPGAFATGRVVAAGRALELEYPRFARMQTPLRLRVSVRPAELAGGELRVWLSSEYLERVTLAHVTPEPLRTELDADGVTYVFAWGGAHGTGVTGALGFELEAGGPGRIRGRIGTRAEDAVEFAHLVYP
jgi:hypothetical protein